jgi:hypothetical protein
LSRLLVQSDAGGGCLHVLHCTTCDVVPTPVPAERQAAQLAVCRRSHISALLLPDNSRAIPGSISIFHASFLVAS